MSRVSSWAMVQVEATEPQGISRVSRSIEGGLEGDGGGSVPLIAKFTYLFVRCELARANDKTGSRGLVATESQQLENIYSSPTEIAGRRVVQRGEMSMPRRVARRGGIQHRERCGIAGSACARAPTGQKSVVCAGRCGPQYGRRGPPHRGSRRHYTQSRVR